MSAGPAPPNPNAPKKVPGPPAPALSRFRPSYIATAAALLGTAWFYFYRPATPRDSPAITLSTPGVKNIEKAYTNAGATPTHTKAYGGTPQGDKDSVYTREGGATGGNGSDGSSPYKQPGVGDDQRPDTQTKGGQIFDQTMYGSHKAFAGVSGEKEVASDSALYNPRTAG